MLLSKQQIPCFYLQKKADLTELLQFRKGPCRKAGIGAGTNDFFFAAMAKAVEKFPLMAGQLDGNAIKIADSVNISFAIETAQGLMVPVIKDVQKKDIRQISQDAKELAEKARTNTLTIDDLSGACISLSSLGMLGLTNFIAITPPGQASILAIGKIMDKLVPVDGKIEERKIMNLTLSVDHRIANGAYAAKFLSCIVELLENPQELAEIKN